MHYAISPARHRVRDWRGRLGRRVQALPSTLGGASIAALPIFLPQHMAAERASAVPVHPAVNAWLVELMLAGQLAQHVATLKVTQADLQGEADSSSP